MRMKVQKLEEKIDHVQKFQESEVIKINEFYFFFLK